MNIEAIRDKMDQFFNNIKPGELVKEFEKRGYVFVDVENVFRGNTYATSHSYPIGSNGSFFTEPDKKSKPQTCFFCLLFI